MPVHYSLHATRDSVTLAFIVISRVGLNIRLFAYTFHQIPLSKSDSLLILAPNGCDFTMYNIISALHATAAC